MLPASSLFLIGCGGGGTTDGVTSVATGEAFYVDSAVSGVDYSCGGHNGVTDERGAFTFEVGQSCTFSLDKITLREVAADELENGKEIQEKNVEVARVLLSLDSDHNPANGIQVDTGIVKSLIDYGMAKVDDIISDWYAVIPGFSLVSEAAAKAHLIQSIASGKTLYTDISGEMGTLESWSFSADLGTLSTVELEGGNVKATVSIDFDAGTFTFTTTEGDRIEVEKIMDEYLLVRINGDESRLYYDEAKARAYFLQ